MLDIYRGAARVIVWLGTASDRTADALDCLSKLSSHIESERSRDASHLALRWLVWTMYYASLLIVLPFLAIAKVIQEKKFKAGIWLATRTGMTGTLFRAASGGRSFQIPLWRPIAYLINLFMYFVFFLSWWDMLVLYSRGWTRNSDPTDTAVDALKDFFSRDWFRRIWIVQEISVAREATVLCGSHALEWKVLMQAVKRMEKEVWQSRVPHPYLDTDYEFASIIATTYTKIRSAKDHEPVSLLYLLSRFCFSKATIEHDKAYGLLGLCPDVHKHIEKGIVLEPRYDKPVEYAFADVVRFSIESRQSLDILRACTGHRRSTQMPSWVPDWRIAERKDSDEGVEWDQRYTLPEFRDTSLSIAEFSADLKSLHVRGVLVGRITDTGEDRMMKSTKTAQVKNLPKDQLPRNFNGSYFYPLLIIFFRIGLVEWFFKLLARRFATQYPDTVLKDAEEVTNILVTEVKNSWNPRGRGFWEMIHWIWKEDIPMTSNVPHFAAHMSEEESWKRNCTWEAVPELDFLPLLIMISPIDVSADKPQPGDVVCMMLGSGVPYVLRDRCGYYELIGSGEIAVINRYVWRAVVNGYRAGKVELREFTIR